MVENDITICTGPAGSGKSSVAVGIACDWLEDGKIDKIVVTRPTIEAGRGIGFLPGPHSVNQVVATPYGWTTLGELSVGDKVIAIDGTPTKVTGVYRLGKKQLYKIHTSDGIELEATLDHYWFTNTYKERRKKSTGSIKSTKEIIDDIDGKHCIPRPKPVQFNDSKIPLDPYVLGVLIGDGALTGTHMRFSSADQEIIDRVTESLHGIGLTVSNRQSASKAIVSTILSCGGGVRCYQKGDYGNPIRQIVTDLKLNKPSYEKFIPPIYKYTSVENRINLLRGLMDTDGNCKKDGEANFSTTSKQLADDVVELVKSLGGTAKIRTRDRRSENNQRPTIKVRRVSYEFTISLPIELNPFYLPRKADRFKSKYIYQNRIVKIEPSREDEVMCISVDHPDHLYLITGFTPTHNTMSEKIAPYLTPILEEFYKYIGKNLTDKYITTGQIEMCPLEYMRGRNFHNSFMILDESQNATMEQLKMFVTRLGMGSRAIIEGDLDQSDLPKHLQDALFTLKTKLVSLPGVGICELEATDIVRNPIIARVLERLK